MNILVTGGAGYIGSVTTESLIASGHRTVVLDNLAKGHRGAVHPEATFVEADVRDGEAVRAALREHEIEAVLHFAAYSLVGESMSRPLSYFGNNSAATVELLTAMSGEGVRKFVLSSTAALFGTPDELPIAEDATIRPASVYGESKYLTERMLGWLARTTGLGYATLRYFNAAGASERFGEDHRPETHLIPLVLEVAQGHRQRIEVFGDDYETPDGTNVRDYIHVCDLAEAHVLAVEALAEGEQRAYNLGNGQGFSVLEVIEACRRVTGCEIPAKVVARRAGDPAILVADSRRIGRELGWRATRPALEEIVSSAWEWRLRHPHGYGD
ncbi:MAG TPA: UDP-glucose 4-epimerase GalE [Trueperaceae bacterium]